MRREEELDEGSREGEQRIVRESEEDRMEERYSRWREDRARY